MKNVHKKLGRTTIPLTHWGRMTHICVGKPTIIVSYNGLSPDRRQAMIWTNAGILLIGHLGTNFSEILFEIHTFSFKKLHLKISSWEWRPSCLGLNVLTRLHQAVFPSLPRRFKNNGFATYMCVDARIKAISQGVYGTWFRWVKLMPFDSTLLNGCVRNVCFSFSSSKRNYESYYHRVYFYLCNSLTCISNILACLDLALLRLISKFEQLMKTLSLGTFFNQ